MPKRLQVPTDEIHNGLHFVGDAKNRVLPSGQKPRTIYVRCTKCEKIFTVLLLHFMRNRAACDCENMCSGDKGTHLFNVWRGMLNRCKPSYFQRQYYFDKGIAVCDEWKDYRKFKEWAMQNGYDQSLQIDRRENNAGYHPGNCRFVTQEYNLSNRDCTVMVLYHGNNTPLTFLCGGSHNRKYELALSRIRRGWEHEKAIDVPPRQGNYGKKRA